MKTFYDPKSQIYDYAVMDRPITKKHPLLQRRTTIILGVGLLFLGGLITLRTRAMMQSAIDMDRIDIATVIEGPFSESILINGTIQPRSSTFIDSPVGGQVEKIFVEEGAYVKKDQPLLQLSNPDLQLEITKNETQWLTLKENLKSLQMQKEQEKFTYEQQIKQLEFEIEQKRRILERNEILKKNGLISAQDYENAIDEYEFLLKKLALLKQTFEHHMQLFDEQIRDLKSNLVQMEDNLQILRSKLAHLLVRSPAEGQLTRFTIEPGQYIQERARIARIDDLSGYRIEARVSEYYLNRMRVGLKGKVALNQKAYAVYVDKVLPSVEDGTFKIELAFETPPSFTLRPGQSIQIDLQLTGQQNAVMIPKGGFFQSTSGQWIFVLNPDETKATRRLIKIGRQNSTHFEILEGLKPGERVIISPYYGFVNRHSIRLKKSR